MLSKRYESTEVDHNLATVPSGTTRYEFGRVENVMQSLSYKLNKKVR